jgi:pilus assembly protein CpaF
VPLDMLDPYFGISKLVELQKLTHEMRDRIVVVRRKLEVYPPDKRAAMLDAEIPTMLDALLAERKTFIGSHEKTWLLQDIKDELNGYGVIEPLLRDDTVDEVMVNGPKQIFVERKGKLFLTNREYKDNAHVEDVIQRIVRPIGRSVDEKRPLCDARLPDGSRVNCVIAPLALDGPTITIRKFKKHRILIEDLVKQQTLSQPMADLLEACVKGRLNMVVSGGTGAGKTTTLNILSNFIPDDQRIVTVEDAAELQIRKPHVIRLETRPPDLQGEGAITIRDLVKNCLRMRPDRIVVGEIRGAEAFDMLQAMNTGHDGSLTTGHANTPRDMVRRIESMCMMAGLDIPMAAIREQISSAIHVFVQQSRLQDGTRRITHITEVQGMEGPTISLADIFTFRQDGVDQAGRVLGSLRPTGVRPRFEAHLKQNGIVLSARMFN